MSRIQTRLSGMAVLALLSMAGCTAPPVQDLVEPGPVSLNRHTVMSDGHPLAVWSKIPENPRGSMVLVHGRTWSALPDFDLQVPGEDLSFMDGLVDAGIAAYAVDLRGYGETPRDSSGWLSADKASNDMEAVLRWVQQETGEPPVLFGWSMGSLVAHLVVQRSPDLASHVVLFGYPWTAGLVVDEDEDPEQPPRVPNTAEAAASDFIIPGSISDLAIQTYVDVSLAADSVRVDWNLLHQFNELDPALVTIPTLLIHGELDPFAPVETQKEVFALIGTSNKQWTIVPGGDHAALLESPREYMLQAVVDFVTRPAHE